MKRFLPPLIVLLWVTVMYAYNGGPYPVGPHAETPRKNPLIIIFKSGHKMLITNYEMHGSGLMITVIVKDRTHLIPLHIVHEIREATDEEMAEAEMGGDEQGELKSEEGQGPPSSYEPEVPGI